MNTRKLEIILKAVETGSISKTAEAMFLSQPSVSESIGSVEKELGIKIFRRSNRGIELTDDGEIFTAYARSIVRNTELMESIGDKHKKCSVSLHGPNISILNDCFVEFCKKHRDSDYIHLTQSNRFYRVEEAEKEILAGECDIAIVHSTPAVYGAMERKLDAMDKALAEKTSGGVDREYLGALTACEDRLREGADELHKLRAAAQFLSVKADKAKETSEKRMTPRRKRTSSVPAKNGSAPLPVRSLSSPCSAESARGCSIISACSPIRARWQSPRRSSSSALCAWSCAVGTARRSLRSSGNGTPWTRTGSGTR